jgi:hypothetical protein
MNKPMLRKIIGLITPYSGDNLGDAAIQSAVIEHLRARLRISTSACSPLTRRRLRHFTRFHPFRSRESSLISTRTSLAQLLKTFESPSLCRDAITAILKRRTHSFRTELKSQYDDLGCRVDL